MSLNVYTQNELVEVLRAFNGQNLPAKLLMFGWHSYFKSIIDLLGPQVLIVSDLYFDRDKSEYELVSDLNTAYLQVDSHIYFMVFEPVTFEDLFKMVFSQSQTFLAVEVTDNQLTRLFDKTFADLQRISDITFVLKQIGDDLNQLKKNFEHKNKFEHLLFSPYLQACCPLLIKQIEIFKDDDDNLREILSNLEFERKLVRITNPFVLVYSVTKDLINWQITFFEQLSSDARAREFVIYHEFLPQYKQLYKEKLLNEIFLLKRLAGRYPELQKELEKKQEEFRNLDSPKKSKLCTFLKQMFKKFGNGKNMFKSIALNLHPDRVNESLSQKANVLMQKLKELENRGNIRALSFVSNLLRNYSFNSKKQADSQIDSQFVEMIHSVLNLFDSQTAILSVNKDLLEKSTDEIRSELQQKLNELQQEIQTLKEQLEIIQ